MFASLAGGAEALADDGCSIFPTITAPVRTRTHRYPLRLLTPTPITGRGKFAIKGMVRNSLQKKTKKKPQNTPKYSQMLMRKN